MIEMSAETTVAYETNALLSKIVGLCNYISFYVLERVSVAERRISMQNVSVVDIIDMIISCERYAEVSLFTCHISVNKIWIGPD